MTNLLLLKENTHTSDELSVIFHQAGYQVVQFDDIEDCCRHLQNTSSVLDANVKQVSVKHSTERQEDHISCYSHEIAKRPRAGTVFLTDNKEYKQIDTGGFPEFLAVILTGTRKTVPTWRLSSRQRSLQAPDGQLTSLTSLEFSFVKIFAMAEVGEAVSRKKIVLAFGEDYLAYDQNRIDTLVRRLRKKMERNARVKLPLNTVRVRGFSFDDVLILDA
ncbi:MAG: helix-turn-helix domain-containing protein [Burkholderiales bacterium]|nr:helix-turn-helix domain-containing protein [Burkholderiales bacterium]